MTDRICVVEGCVKPLRARGYCCAHWALWRKYGTPAGRPTRELCSVSGCDRPVRSKFAEHCETHYYRLRRTGTVADRPQISGPCSTEGCVTPADHGGLSVGRPGLLYCRMHYLRIKKHGDEFFECRGTNHPGWLGDSATYEVLHQRVRKARGSASRYGCVDCGARAKHWSYDRSDPDAKFQPGKGPYSLDIDRYVPRCVSCHKRFDMAFVMADRQDA